MIHVRMGKEDEIDAGEIGGFQRACGVPFRADGNGPDSDSDAAHKGWIGQDNDASEV